MGTPVASFFNGTGTSKYLSSSTPLQVSQQRTVVDVGGTGDCGFRAIAAGITDNLLTNPRANKQLFTDLNEWLQHCPPSLLTPTKKQQLEDIFNNPNRLNFIAKNHFLMADFIIDFAFILRQISVDNLIANPAEYRGAFITTNEQTSPYKMRQANTWIDESAIAALANALQLPINVQVVVRDKILPARLKYGREKESANELVVIQLQNNHYLPKVFQPQIFNIDKMPVTRTSISTTEAFQASDPALESIIAKIAQADEQLKEKFDSHFMRLMRMVTAGEVNKNKLLAIYINGMNKGSDYLQGYKGLQHGSEQFFAMLKQKDQSIVHQVQNGETQLTYDLVHAIARAMTINHLDEEKVYRQIDEGYLSSPLISI